jgi:hypothetical protein
VTSPKPSPNFAFLAYHDPLLVALATQAEAVFPHDAAACLVRLPAFGEHLAKRAAASDPAPSSTNNRPKRGRKGRPPKNP